MDCACDWLGKTARVTDSKQIPSRLPESPDNTGSMRQGYPMLHAAILILFPALMAFAAFSDLFTMTISNRISLGLLAGFLAVGFASGMSLHDIGMHLSCGAAVLVGTFTLFAFGWIGGGDAKLAAATAIWLGWEHLADYGVISAALGGFLTLGILYLRKWPLPNWLMDRAWIARLHDKTSGVPYGIALAGAGLFVYPETRIWLSAAIS
jgi:prepilin peptidase CpaA